MLYVACTPHSAICVGYDLVIIVRRQDVDMWGMRHRHTDKWRCLNYHRKM